MLSETRTTLLTRIRRIKVSLLMAISLILSTDRKSRDTLKENGFRPNL